MNAVPVSAWVCNGLLCLALLVILGWCVWIITHPTKHTEGTISAEKIKQCQESLLRYKGDYYKQADK